MSDWNAVGRLIVGANSDVVVAALTGGGYGDHDVHAFDRHSGRALWTYPFQTHLGYDGRRFFVQDGRVYVYRPGIHAGGLILDALTGEALAGPDAIERRWLFSPTGHFALEPHWPAEKPTVHVLDPKTGLVQAEWPLPGEIRAVTDSGIAYCAAGPSQHPSISALRLADGVLLWRTDEGMSRWCVPSDTAVFCVVAGGVQAHDAGTGEVLWRWQSPGTVRSLLALWGVRTPWMLAYSTSCISSTVAAAFAQRAPREIGLTLRRELAQGQWRHPRRFMGGGWLVAGREIVFYGTSLGVFALRARDGRLLWHVLPTTNVSSVPPALAPP